MEFNTGNTLSSRCPGLYKAEQAQALAPNKTNSFLDSCGKLAQQNEYGSRGHLPLAAGKSK
jgi:hypothetical protein